jgi:hypothetical protein
MTGGGLAKLNYQLNKMSCPPTSQKNAMTPSLEFKQNINPPPPPMYTWTYDQASDLHLLVLSTVCLYKIFRIKTL